MDWRTTVRNLQSEHITDRGRAVRSLLDLLGSNDHLNELATLRPFLTIQHVFQAVNSCVAADALQLQVKESRPGASMDRIKEQKNFLTKMVEKVLEKTEEKRNFLDATSLTEALNNVFLNTYIRENFGAVYYMSIVCLLLKHRSYWKKLGYNQWKDLIRISIVAYNDKIDGLIKSRVGKSISFLISQGTKNSCLSLWIVSKMDFFISCIRGIPVDHPLQEKEAIMMIVVSFSKAIAVENRRKLCQFGEEVLDDVLRLMDHTVADVNLVKCLVLDFVNLQLKAHHPNSEKPSSQAAYANDWIKWANLLHSMYHCINEELENVAIRSRSSAMEEEVYGRCVEFAVEVIYQITFLPEEGIEFEYEEEGEEPVPNKRQRVVSGLPSFLEVAGEENRQDEAWPWLHVLAALIDKHKDVINENNYVEILRLIVEMFGPVRGNVVLRHAMRCCRAMAMVPKSEYDNEEANMLWDRIWGVALRSMGVLPCDEAVNGAIQAMLLTISERKVNELFHLFMKERFAATQHNVRTLRSILFIYPVTGSMRLCDKKEMIKWIFDVKPKLKIAKKAIPADVLSDVLVQLSLRDNTQYDKIESSILPTRSFGNYHCKINFSMALSMGPEKEEALPDLYEVLEFNEVVVEYVKSMLCLNIDFTIDWLIESIRFERVHLGNFEATQYAVNRLKLLALLYDKLINWRGLNIDDIIASDFLQMFPKVFKDLSELLKRIYVQRKDWLKNLKITINELKSLYDLELEDRLKVFLLENTPRLFMNFCMNVIKERREEIDELFGDRNEVIFTRNYMEPYVPGTMNLFSYFHSIIDKNVLAQENVIRVLISEMLGSYCCTSANYEPYANQIQVITQYLTVLPLEYRRNFTLLFQMIYAFISTPIKRGAIDPQYLNYILDMFIKFVDDNPGDVEVFNIALSTFEEMLNKDFRGQATFELIIHHLKYFIKKLEGWSRHNLPPSTLKRITRVVGCIAKVDYSWTSDWLQSSGELLEISTYLLQLLDSDFAEVRLNVAENLFPIFKQLHYARLEWRPTLISWINYILGSCCEDDSTCPERKENQVLCGLHCLTIVAIVTPYYRKLAIYNILKLLIDFGIRQSVGSTILSVICRELKINDSRSMLEKYMQYLMEKWLLHKQLEKFPYWLLCNSLTDFYHQNKTVIFSLMWMLNHKDLEMFCSLLETSVKRMLIENSAHVLAFSLQRTVKMYDSESWEEMKNMTQQVMDKIQRFSPELAFYQIVSSKENSFLYESLSLFHDTEALNAASSNNIVVENGHEVCTPEPDPYHYSKVELHESFDHLANLLGVDQCILKYCVSKSPEHLKDVILRLAKDAVNAPSQSDCFVSLVAFNELVECIAKELQSAYVSNLSMICTGFLRDVCFTFIRVMRKKWWNENDVASCTAFFFLNNFITRYHAPFQNASKIVIVPLIGALVDLVEDGMATNFESRVLKMIEDLVQMDFLREAMYSLCPFPSSKVFDNIRKLFKELITSEIGTSLRRTFTQFLENYHTYGYCRIESLQHIKNELKLNKEELNVFYKEMKSKRKAFSLYKNCLLHRVVCLLTRLCRSPEPKQATEAAKCLAEIGSADLETLVLTHQNFETDHVPPDVMEKNPLHKLILKCVEILPRYLIDYDLVIVETASDVLNQILGSAEGTLALSKKHPYQLKLAEDFMFRKPVPSTSKRTLPLLVFDESSFCMTVDLWIPSETINHAQWVTNLTKGLLKCIGGCSFMDSLDRMCSLKVSLCEEIFPLVMEVLLHCGGSIGREALFGKIGEFFRASYRTFVCEIRGQALDADVPPLKNKTIILTMLNAINLLSLQHPGKHEEYSLIPSRQKGKKSNRRNSGGSELLPKSINYLHCAVSAQNCSAFLSAIQYSSLWLNENTRGSQQITLTVHFEMGTEGIHEILDVLQKSYAGIGDVDSLCGFGTGLVLEPKGRIKYFQQRGEWEQVMRSYELELSNGGPQKCINGLMEAMLRMGMEDLLMSTLDYRESEEFLKFKYECAWRLGSWELLSNYNDRRQHSSELSFLDSISYMPDNTSGSNVDLIFHRNLFLSLRCIKNNKFSESLELVETSRHFVIDSMSLASLEVSNNLCEAITRLQTLKDVQDFATSVLNFGVTGVNDVIQSWKRSDAIGHKNFGALESLKAVRLTLLQHCFDDIERDQEGLAIINQPTVRESLEIMLEIGRSARENGMYSVSEKYLRAVRRFENVCNDPYFMPKLVLEEAKLFACKGNKFISRNLLNNLVQGIDVNCNSENCLTYSQALTALGELTVETHAEKSRSPLLKYFDHAAEIINNFEVSKRTDEFLNATAAMATYADEQYVLLSKYVDSSEFKKKKKGALYSMNIVSDGHSIKKPTLDEKRSMIMLEKQAELDKVEITEAKANRLSYYTLAFRNYVKYLQYSDNTRLEMLFRFLHLLLEELDNEEDELMNQMSCIPSHKFLPMIPQLIPRMTQSKGVYITSVIERCALEHPHHVLPYIMVVAHSLSDLESEKGSDTFITNAQKANSIAAQNLILRIKSNPVMTEYICQLEKLWQVLINFAKAPAGTRNQREMRVVLPAVHPLNSLNNLNLVQIPTVDLKISPSKDYNIVSVWKYCSEFSLVGGINVPKKITCIGSNGVKYHQLLKGKDDMRQDAVMQQVFQLMNNLLMREEEAQKNDLKMRTYKVVPLSLRSGIIEWVENTTSLGSYLQGDRDGGAHVRYNPQDYSPKACRSMMQSVMTSSKVVRQQVFLDIMDHIKPVFRHYFLERFPNPALWYEMRQAYTRSVATSSIIGYVLGLGDRHLYNILIDEITSEVIHIDLGIAFEQGKTLNTPETVPFRLTRDIIDGMGETGVEGVFRRSCEITMRLMRKYKSAIVSVLQVLIYDPLYSWTFKPKHLSVAGEEGVSFPPLDQPPDISKPGPSRPRPSSSNADRKSSSPIPGNSPALSNASSVIPSQEIHNEKPEEERNAIAERAIVRLEQKLMGLDNGDQAPSSIEAQVERLILEAQDIENLCMLFPGWQPFL